MSLDGAKRQTRKRETNHRFVAAHLVSVIPAKLILDLIGEQESRCGLPEQSNRQPKGSHKRVPRRF